eukprot:5920784-Pleurochrysis_carterae.AAC.4
MHAGTLRPAESISTAALPLPAHSRAPTPTASVDPLLLPHCRTLLTQRTHWLLLKRASLPVTAALPSARLISRDAVAKSGHKRRRPTLTSTVARLRFQCKHRRLSKEGSQ